MPSAGEALTSRWSIKTSRERWSWIKLYTGSAILEFNDHYQLQNWNLSGWALSERVQMRIIFLCSKKNVKQLITTQLSIWWYVRKCTSAPNCFIIRMLTPMRGSPCYWVPLIQWVSLHILCNWSSWLYAWEIHVYIIVTLYNIAT
jgi:hypothetical protein